jgi:hypothetical protein
MFNQCYCCYSKPILDVADNKFAESAAVLMLNQRAIGLMAKAGMNLALIQISLLFLL